jgi:hypothetical protein
MARSDRSLVQRANKEISVFEVLETEFDVRHPREGQSYKGYCPFAFEHPDGGMDKGFRTYPGTNSAYCFVQHGYLTPVRLIQLKDDLTVVEAAKKLLDSKGLLEPPDPFKRWHEVKAAHDREEIGEPQVLVEALHTKLAQHPGYVEHAMDQRFMQVMEHQLGVLDRILADERVSDFVVRAWFSKACFDLEKTLTTAMEEVAV